MDSHNNQNLETIMMMLQVFLILKLIKNIMLGLVKKENLKRKLEKISLNMQKVNLHLNFAQIKIFRNRPKSILIMFVINFELYIFDKSNFYY